MFIVKKLYSPDQDENKGGDPAKQKPDEKLDGKDTDTVALLKALKEAKENSVPKADYEALKAEKDKIVSEIINGDGGSGNGQTPPPEQPDIAKLREELYGPKCSDLSNLDYWKKTLELRKAVRDKGEPDPFLPIGTKISPTSDDIAKAEKVAEVVQECIDQCDGNSEVFTALLQSRTNNDSTEMTMRLKKLGIKFK